MPVPTLSGIQSQMLPTKRLKTYLLSAGSPDKTPILFLHGNFSSATYWEEMMLALAGDYYCLAPDLRGYGQSEDLLVDGTRGARDWSDDIAALLDALNIEAAHLVGWSLGAAVVMQFALDYAARVKSMTLVSPVSPYGFGGSKGVDGQPCYEDFAGSGGGVVNPEFVRRIKEGDRSADDPNSPRNVINSFYYKAPFKAAREEAFLDAALQEKMGDDRYPGDMVPSANWPNVAPGKWGPINATSPKYFNTAAITELAVKPPVLWIRGEADMIVADNSMFDFGTLGQMGFVPGWPGADVYPPQPMVSQMRHVLDGYQANGGACQEVVIADAAHSPHIEKPDEFKAALERFLA